MSAHRLINNFIFEFGKEFCEDGKINWTALVKFNSAAKHTLK